MSGTHALFMGATALFGMGAVKAVVWALQGRWEAAGISVAAFWGLAIVLAVIGVWVDKK